MNSATAPYDEHELAATAPNNSTTRRVRTFGRRIAGACKELSRGHSRTGPAFVMLYPHAKRIEVSWGDATDHTGISMSFTRDQALQTGRADPRPSRPPRRGLPAHHRRFGCPRDAKGR